MSDPMATAVTVAAAAGGVIRETNCDGNDEEGRFSAKDEKVCLHLIIFDCVLVYIVRVRLGVLTTRVRKAFTFAVGARCVK